MKRFLIAGALLLMTATGASAQHVTNRTNQVQDQSAAAVGDGNTIIQNASQTTVNRIRIGGGRRRFRPQIRRNRRVRVRNRVNQIQRQSAAAVGHENIQIQSGSQRTFNGGVFR